MEFQSALEKEVDSLQPPSSYYRFSKCPAAIVEARCGPWKMNETVFGVSLSLKAKSRQGLT